MSIKGTENKINEISIFQPDWFKKIYFLGVAETYNHDESSDRIKTNQLVFLKSHNDIYTFVFTTEYTDLQFDKIAESQDVSFFKLDSIKDFELLMLNENFSSFHLPDEINSIQKKQEYGRTILGPCIFVTAEEEVRKSIFSSYFTLIVDDMYECSDYQFKDFIEKNFSLEKIISFKDENKDIITIDNNEKERD